MFSADFLGVKAQHREMRKVTPERFSGVMDLSEESYGKGVRVVDGSTERRFIARGCSSEELLQRMRRTSRDGLNEEDSTWYSENLFLYSLNEGSVKDAMVNPNIMDDDMGRYKEDGSVGAMDFRIGDFVTCGGDLFIITDSKGKGDYQISNRKDSRLVSGRSVTFVPYHRVPEKRRASLERLNESTQSTDLSPVTGYVSSSDGYPEFPSMWEGWSVEAMADAEAAPDERTVIFSRDNGETVDAFLVVMNRKKRTLDVFAEDDRDQYLEVAFEKWPEVTAGMANTFSLI